jgi:cytochrome c-type biogenesis protein CcmF
MVIAHLGVAVCVLGVTFTSLYGSYRDVRIGINETVQLGDYHFTYKGLSSKQGPNYQADVAVIDVYRKGKLVSQLYPEKRFYPVRQMLQTEAAIDPGLFHDLYVSMGEPLGDQGAWSFRLQYKPLVRWIWLGAILMAIGAILAVYDKRYRRSISR